MNLLDMMTPPPKPLWRNREAIAWSSDLQEGDLAWLPHDHRDHRKGGRWFRYEKGESIWRCIDPYDETAINKRPDTPPMLDSHGRIRRRASA